MVGKLYPVLLIADATLFQHGVIQIICNVCGHVSNVEMTTQQVKDFVRDYHYFTCSNCGNRFRDRVHIPTNPIYYAGMWRDG